MYNGFIVLDKYKNNKIYDGKTYKFGITYNNNDYIVKFAQNSISSLYSEYVASRFIFALGISCHKVWFGIYNNTPVVILKDFTNKGDTLRSFQDTQQSSEDTDLYNKEYTYNDIIYLIDKHTKMSDSNKLKAKAQFWQMFIMDAILGNRDRHRGNWGYIKNNGKYRPAPIYDNGNSLFPDIEQIINNYIECCNNGKEFEFIKERSEKFPASLLKIKSPNGEYKRTNYYEVLGDLRINKTLAYQVKTLKEKVGFNGVYLAINSVVMNAKDYIPLEYRRFYVIIVCVRYLHIIERKSIKESYNIAVRRINK